MNNFKLKSIAACFAFSFVFTASAGNLLEEGQELLNDGYESTGVAAVEQVRMPINTTFKASVELYEQYYKKAFANADYENFYKSVEGKDEEAVTAALNNLSGDKRKQVLAVNEANNEMFSTMGKLLAELLIQQTAFNKLDAKSALAGLSMWDMPSALGAFKSTGNELVFISDSIGEIHRISEILDAHKTAV